MLDPAASATVAHVNYATINLTGVKGVVLRNSGDTSNKVALFGANGPSDPITQAFSFSIPNATTTKVILVDQPNAKFNISVTGTNPKTVTITPSGSGSWSASGQGVVHVDIAGATNQVTDGQ